MNFDINHFLIKLTSRKLWLAIVNFVTMIMVAFNATDSEISQITALIMAGAGILAYLIAEGWSDSKGGE